MPRALAVAPGAADAARIAVRMPGFGWLLGAPGTSAAAPAFAYACDALIGVSPLEEQAPMAYRSDGTLIAARERHPLLVSGRLPDHSDAAERRHDQRARGDPGEVRPIACTRSARAQESLTIVQRSDDGGEHWTQGATLERLPVSALVLGSHDPDAVYVSQDGSSAGGSIAVSSDGGATFKTVAQERALTLVYVQDEPARFWATARVAGKGVGVDILRASARKVRGKSCSA